MFFANNGTSSQVALTKITIGDLAVASKSLLAFHNTWQLSSLGLNSGSTWGWFLTSNKTITKATFYNPDNDPSVVLHAKYTCNSGCGGGTPSIGITTKFLRTTGQSDTVSSEDTGNCSQSGSDFLCNILPDPALNNVFDSAFYLNYTGIVNGNSCTVSGNPGIIGPAPGCSWR